MHPSIDRHENRCQARFRFQGELVKALLSGPLPPKLNASSRPWVRGKITEFSRASRKRLLEYCAILDWSAQKAVFVTTTYHHLEPTPEQAKRHLRAFLKRIQRLYGDHAVIWRLERQARGTIHFHLLLFGVPFMPLALLLKWWREITGEATITQLNIALIDSARRARRYVSKYVAKPTGDEGSPCVLDTPSYLAADPCHGRFWGIEGRAKLVFAPLIEVWFPVTKAFYDMKRAARRVWGGVNRSGRCGFSLFVDDSEVWYDYFLLLALS